MRPILCLLLLLLSFAGRAQTDRNGNPVFNSVTLETDTFDGCELSYNYYTLQNNIDNPASSVFIDKKPSLNQIEAAAVKLPSHFFVLTRNEQVVSMVLLTEDPRRQYVVVDLNTGEPKTFPCTLTGDLPEERVLELLDLGWDPAAKRQDNRFYFNDKPFTILPAAALQADVRKLIQAQKLTEAAASDTRIVSSAVLRAAILTGDCSRRATGFFYAPGRQRTGRRAGKTRGLCHPSFHGRITSGAVLLLRKA